MERRQRCGLTHQSPKDTDVPSTSHWASYGHTLPPSGQTQEEALDLPASRCCLPWAFIFLSTGPRRVRMVSSERGQKTTRKIPTFTRSLLLPFPHLVRLKPTFSFELFSTEGLNVGVSSLF